MKVPVPLIQDFVNHIERAAGHTTCAMVGAKATGATLIVAGSAWAAELRAADAGLKIATWRQVMAGEVHGPLIIDPGVLQDLVGVTREYRASMPRELVDPKRFPLLAAWVGPSYCEGMWSPEAEPVRDDDDLGRLFRKVLPRRTAVEFVDGGIVHKDEVDGVCRSADWVAVSTTSGPARFPKMDGYGVIRRLFNRNGDVIWEAPGVTS